MALLLWPSKLDNTNCLSQGLHKKKHNKTKPTIIRFVKLLWMRFDLLKSEKFKTWNDTRDRNQILLHPLESVLSVTRSFWLNHFFRYLHRLHIWLGCMPTVSARHSSRYPPLVNLSPSRRHWFVAFSNFPSHSQVFPHEKNFLDVTWLITNFFSWGHATL